ncbi:hypothetical protein GCM10009678_68490 [Actinomadura kijaniata]|uniref:Uncharacterized protein n=1 Tax=Actinomadura namibiensis TaxID=182080 RepID=A0A7W3LZ08_ACTNM|nr:hypothetical protein [Actinomadura namibiensis]MBA8956813.1 hypothetical protein [Actinomadura namibiensis]
MAELDKDRPVDQNGHGPAPDPRTEDLGPRRSRRAAVGRTLLLYWVPPFLVALFLIALDLLGYDVLAVLPDVDMPDWLWTVIRVLVAVVAAVGTYSMYKDMRGRGTGKETDGASGSDERTVRAVAADRKQGMTLDEVTRWVQDASSARLPGDTVVKVDTTWRETIRELTAHSPRGTTE